jgi:hypothetical protein
VVATSSNARRRQQWRQRHRAELKKNVKATFEAALVEYHERQMGPSVTLKFKVLGAGYGEHLFNEIARDIISADIAVFDASDLNPNVMLEMGVALTWGVRGKSTSARKKSAPVVWERGERGAKRARTEGCPQAADRSHSVQ